MTEIPAQTGTAQNFDPRSSRIRITRRDDVYPSPVKAAAGLDARQAWHASLIAANQTKTWWTEQYESRQKADAAVTWLGMFVSPVHQATIYAHHAAGHMPYAGYLEIALDEDELGAKYSIPIEYVDERTQDGA